MPWLVLGVVIFFGVHLLPSAPKLRKAARDRVGARPYQGIYALVALVGLVLIVVGIGQAPFIPLWNPPSWGRTVALYAMPVALILFGSFGLYSLFDMASANRRGATLSKTVYPLWRDAALVVAGLLVYTVLLYGHGWLFGPALV